MAGLHLIKTYSSDSDEDKHDEQKEDDDKIINKYKLYIYYFRLVSFKSCLVPRNFILGLVK